MAKRFHSGLKHWLCISNGSSEKARDRLPSVAGRKAYRLQCCLRCLSKSFRPPERQSSCLKSSIASGRSSRTGGRSRKSISHRGGATPSDIGTATHSLSIRPDSMKNRFFFQAEDGI